MSKKFSELTGVSGSVVNGSALVAVVSSGITLKATVDQIISREKVCTLEQFGAVGDGVTSDQPAFEAARAALVAGTYNTLLIGAKTYLVQGTVDPTNNPFPFGITIVGQGPQSILKTTTNGSVIAFRSSIAGNRAKATLVANLAILGDGKGTGKTSQDAFRSGYLGSDGSSRTVFLNCYAKDIGGHGFINAYSDKLGTGGLNINCRAESCWTGLVGQEGESYGYQGIACTIGTRIGGNHSLIGGAFEDCDTAYQLSAGGNDAHGLLVGVSFTHNTIALDYGASVNGQYAIGIRIFDGAINIANGNTNFHEFTGCHLEPTAFNALGKTRWLNCTFSDSYYASSSFTGGENEFDNPRGELGTILSWIGQQHEPQIQYASNADKTLTSQQSLAPLIEVIAGSESATVNLFNTRTPSRSEKQIVVNRTAQAIKYYWASGTGIQIPATKTALIGFDNSGTNMICYVLSDNAATSVARP